MQQVLFGTGFMFGKVLVMRGPRPELAFAHFARTATEVSARARLDPETKTVRDGGVLYQELLPAETLLYSVILASPSRSSIVIWSNVRGRGPGSLRAWPARS